MARRPHHTAANTPDIRRHNPELQATVELPARHWMEPYRQGEFDGLCALYATLNALRLALAPHVPLTRAECKHLFLAGCRYLDRKGALGRTVTDGMGRKRRDALTAFLLGKAEPHGIALRIERAPSEPWTSIEQAFAWITDSLAAGKPVLVSFLGGYAHSTVVTGITPASLLLFDSNGQQFLQRSSCALQHGIAIISQRALMRIAVERSDAAATRNGTV